MREIVDNAARTRRIRGLVIGAAAFCCLCLWLAADVLASDGIAIAGVIALLGGVVLWAAILYAGNYVIQARCDQADIELVTVHILGTRTRRFSRRAVTDVAFHAGQRLASEADLPYATVRIAGRVLPFLVDLSAGWIDMGALRSLRGVSP